MYKATFYCIILIFAAVANLKAQVSFTEYALPNGLHVILHEDHHAPVVAVTMMYHVGSKNEAVGRTGFAHFFEHLLFEGTTNIKRGEFMKIVTARGGQNNANTTQDRTFFYELFPSNELATGLWLESERMMHPVINEVGVKTQNEVVKEERRLRVDNSPYGNFSNSISAGLFAKHPYHNSVIGAMTDLDSAKLDEFKLFFKQYYCPNNAVLSIAGDINITHAKELIVAYFGPIQRGPANPYIKIQEPPLNKLIIDTTYDSNIQTPAFFSAYRIPGRNTRDAKVLEMIASILSSGGSSRLHKTMIDETKHALQVFANANFLEDYGMYYIGALPNKGVKSELLLSDIDKEIKSLQTDLISEDDYRKLQNKIENSFISKNSYMLAIAENLANGYLFYKNTNEINKELATARSITRTEIREVARKYLDNNARLLLYYLPSRKNS